MRQLAILTTILAAMPALMGADVYRWTDANGVINYTQQKPQGVNAELISASGRVRGDAAPQAVSAAAPAVANSGSTAGLNQDQQKIMEELKAAEAERKIAYEAAKKDNCERSQSVLSRLSSVGRVRVTADDGSVTILGEDERQKRISDAQRGVAENCS